MHRNKENGLTLVEILVIAPIIILLIGTFVAFILQLTGDAVAENARIALLNDVNSSLDRIESDVKLSGAFLSKKQHDTHFTSGL